MGLGSSLFASDGKTSRLSSSSPSAEYSTSSASSSSSTTPSPLAEDGEDADEDILDLRQQFHNTVRENIIFLLFFLTLCIMSWTVIGIFIRKKDKDEVDQQRSSTSGDDNNKDKSLPPADDDESLVYRICFWLCVFSLSISIGAALLLPLSIVSNEVLLLYPDTYYVQWLNGMLIQGLWNLIFLFANISLFILLPFAHLFIESEGFSGNRKGLAGKFYETVVVLILCGFAIWGLSHILAAILSPERSSLLGGLFNLMGFSNQLPFIYSCISFCGVLLLLLCTPLGAGRLFTVLSQLLVGPQFLRNLGEEHRIKGLEIEALRNQLKRKLHNDGKMRRYLLQYYENKREEEKRRQNQQQQQHKGKNGASGSSSKTAAASAQPRPTNGRHNNNGHGPSPSPLGGGDAATTTDSLKSSSGGGHLDMIALQEKWDRMIQAQGGWSSSTSPSSPATSGEDGNEDNVDSLLDQIRDPTFIALYHKMLDLSPQGQDFVGETESSVRSRIRGMEVELGVLEKLKKTPGWKRNLLYPLTFLIVLALTALTVLLVIVNTLQLLVGLKALPLSAQTVSLGLSSMSVLGAWGAGVEIILILYLMTTSLIGLYSLPGVRKIRPRRGDSPTAHIIYNCALVLILSSALPLLSRILGITNFDLLGNYGKIEWLGNFYIVLLYNVIFSVASTLCLVNKFTSAIRQELFLRLRSGFRFRAGQGLIQSPVVTSRSSGSGGGGGGLERGASPASGGSGSSLPPTPIKNAKMNLNLNSNLLGNLSGDVSSTTTTATTKSSNGLDKSSKKML